MCVCCWRRRCRVWWLFCVSTCAGRRVVGSCFVGLGGNGKLYGILGNIHLDDNGRGKRDSFSLLFCVCSALLSHTASTHGQDGLNKNKLEGVHVDVSDRQDQSWLFRCAEMIHIFIFYICTCRNMLAYFWFSIFYIGCRAVFFFLLLQYLSASGSLSCLWENLGFGWLLFVCLCLKNFHLTFLFIRWKWPKLLFKCEMFN